MKKLYGLDIETYDPLLTTAGSSWKYGKGYILCTALYNESADKLAVIAGDHNDASGQPKEERDEGNALIELLLKCPDACIVGANILYDIGWLIYEYGMSVYDIKCSFVDVLQAEHLLDEFGNHSLESVSRKYLGYGKSKDLAEEYVREHISKTGDFRRYLKDVPYEILETYVKGDAKNPVKVWRKQLTLLKEQDLCKRAKLEFDCILPTLAMTVNGIPFDLEQKNKNLSLLTEAIDLLQEDFVSRYNLPKFRITATRDIASFCDMRGIPYKNKITLTGYDGKKFADGNETDEAYRRAKRIVSQFRLKKGKPVAYVPHEIAERTETLLKNEGFMFNSSPNMDKGYFASQRDNYPEIALIADWKSAVGIKSKMLGEEYNRFLSVNSMNETCLKPEFSITNTVSFRYSSKNPNCISGEMRVLTDRGWKKIKALKVGDAIYNGNGNLTTVKNIWNKGIQKCLLTVSANGYRIVTTPEHKVWTGAEEKEIYGCEQIAIIQRRAGREIVQANVDKRTDSRCTSDRQEHCFKYSEKVIKRGRICIPENSAQNTYSRSLCESRRGSEVCKRIYFRTKTLLQRFMYKVQSFLKQREELFEKVSDRGTKKGTAQFTCSSSEIPTERLYKKAQCQLQRHLYRFGRLCFCICRGNRRRNTQSQIKPESICRCLRLGRSSAAENNGSTSYRHEPLEQRLGQLGSLYTTSAQKVAQYFTKATEVYDIEVASADHSFICEGFRIFNCQQIPSKNGLEFTTDKGREISLSFPKLTRALFKASLGCVFGKIDYGQIEYRLICNIACGEAGEKVRAEYAKNPKLDFHQYVVDLTGLSRKYAKNMSFGVSFGMGLPSMAESFGWSMEKAEEIASAYHEHMPFVQPTLELVGDVAKQRGYIKTVCGSHARLHDPKKSYTMLNRYTQGSGAECLKSSIIRAYREGLWERLKPANTIHDEISFPYLEPTVECMKDFMYMAEIMRTSVPSLRVPLEAEIELGDNWASTKTVPEWEEAMRNRSTDWQESSKELKRAVLICLDLNKENET